MKTKEELKREVAETRLPEGTKELFYKVLDTADFATLSEEEQISYESNLKNYMDTMSCIRFARKEGISEGFEEGREEGRSEGRYERDIEIAKSMKADGFDNATIAKYTNLSVEDLQKL